MACDSAQLAIRFNPKMCQRSLNALLGFDAVLGSKDHKIA